MDISVLFQPSDSAATPAQVELRRRYEVAATFMLDNPYHSDHLLRDHLITVFGISRTQAYRDIAEVKKVVGNIKNAGKEWHRHTAITMALETYNLAKDKGDLKAMNAATANLTKITKLSKEDVDDFNWEKVIPPTFTPTPDITVLNLPGYDPDLNARRRAALMKKFLNQSAEDVDTIDN